MEGQASSSLYFCRYNARHVLLVLQNLDGSSLAALLLVVVVGRMGEVGYPAIDLGRHSSNRRAPFPGRGEHL
jgi:hypothetical protein